MEFRQRQARRLSYAHHGRPTVAFHGIAQVKQGTFIGIKGFLLLPSRRALPLLAKGDHCSQPQQSEILRPAVAAERLMRCDVRPACHKQAAVKVKYAFGEVGKKRPDGAGRPKWIHGALQLTDGKMDDGELIQPTAERPPALFTPCITKNTSSAGNYFPALA